MDIHFSALLTSDGLIGLLMLTLMEIVLGIDNIVFISIVCDRLPREQQKLARNLGLLLALVFRIGLLLSIKWIIGLTYTVVHIPGLPHEAGDLSWKDLILIGGGLFLTAKSVSEIHEKMTNAHVFDPGARPVGFMATVAQIVMLDIVFSFDSILTAVGVADEVAVMITAVVVSLAVMLLFAGYISDFINRRPTIKMLALSFLILIGFLLIAEGLNQHVDKGYIYFAMAFSLLVEMLNIQLRRRTDRFEHLHNDKK